MKKIIYAFLPIMLFSNLCYAEIGKSLEYFQKGTFINQFQFEDHREKTLKIGGYARLYKNKEENLIELVLDKDKAVVEETIIFRIENADFGFNLLQSSVILAFISEASGNVISKDNINSILDSISARDKFSEVVSGFVISGSLSKGRTIGVVSLSITKEIEAAKGAVQEETSKGSKGICVEGIVGDSVAINGGMFKKGEEINGFKIVKIKEDFVEFEKDQKKFIRKMGECNQCVVEIKEKDIFGNWVISKLDLSALVKEQKITRYSKPTKSEFRVFQYMMSLVRNLPRGKMSENLLTRQLSERCEVPVKYFEEIFVKFIWYEKEIKGELVIKGDSISPLDYNVASSKWPYVEKWIDEIGAPIEPKSIVQREGNDLASEKKYSEEKKREDFYKALNNVFQEPEINSDTSLVYKEKKYPYSEGLWKTNLDNLGNADMKECRLADISVRMDY